MIRFSPAAFVHRDRNCHINNGFIRILAAGSARLGTEMPLPAMLDEDGFSVRERYSAMHRLLADDDELLLIRSGFPESAKRLRRAHRNCYSEFVTCLAQEIRAARRLRTLGMASRKHWSFWTLLEQTLLSESSLLYLRWLGWRHAVGMNVAARDIKECLDLVISGPRFRLAAS